MIRYQRSIFFYLFHPVVPHACVHDLASTVLPHGHEVTEGSSVLRVSLVSSRVNNHAPCVRHKSIPPVVLAASIPPSIQALPSKSIVVVCCVCCHPIYASWCDTRAPITPSVLPSNARFLFRERPLLRTKKEPHLARIELPTHLPFVRRACPLVG